MRWTIIRVLLHKEALRHLANRGGLVLAGLLVVLDMLLAFFNRPNVPAGGFIGGVQRCYVDYWEDGPWVRYLRQHVPPELNKQIQFRAQPQPGADPAAFIEYPANTGAIQLRTESPGYRVVVWHPGRDPGTMAHYSDWFWKTTFRFFHAQAAARLDQLQPGAGAQLHLPELDGDSAWAQKEAYRYLQNQVKDIERTITPNASAAIPLPTLWTNSAQLQGVADMQSTIAAALVLFALFFICVYLLPSLTCEERERGILLAQALSPASAGEILGAKFLFYPAVALGLVALMTGLYDFHVLIRPFFWLAASVSALGSLAIGLTIASLARTQRAASLGALSYLMVVTMFLFICQQNQIPFLPYLALEYHAPRMLQAAISNEVRVYHWGSLAGATVLTAVWCGLAIWCFRRQGWQ